MVKLHRNWLPIHRKLCVGCRLTILHQNDILTEHKALLPTIYCDDLSKKTAQSTILADSDNRDMCEFTSGSSAYSQISQLYAHNRSPYFSESQQLISSTIFATGCNFHCFLALGQPGHVRLSTWSFCLCMNQQSDTTKMVAQLRTTRWIWLLQLLASEDAFS